MKATSEFLVLEIKVLRNKIIKFEKLITLNFDKSITTATHTDVIAQNNFLFYPKGTSNGYF